MQKDMVSLAPAVVLDKKGVRIPWKILVILGAILAGGGFGSLGLQAFLGASASADELHALDAKNAVEHRDIQGALADQQQVIEEHKKAIKSVTVTVEKIESTQTRDIARIEARRLTDSIRNRQEADREYDRLFEQNLRRLARGLDPCGTLACE